MEWKSGAKRGKRGNQRIKKGVDQACAAVLLFSIAEACLPDQTDEKSIQALINFTDHNLGKEYTNAHYGFTIPYCRCKWPA